MLLLGEDMVANMVELVGLVEMRDTVDLEGTLQLIGSEMTAMASEMMMVIVALMAEAVALAETRMVEMVEIPTTVQTQPLLAYIKTTKEDRYPDSLTKTLFLDPIDKDSNYLLYSITFVTLYFVSFADICTVEVYESISGPHSRHRRSKM
jgi:hypothetical protein